MALSSSLAQVSSAATAPPVSSGPSEKDRLADEAISLTAMPMASGRPCPPYAVGEARPFQPASQKAL